VGDPTLSPHTTRFGGQIRVLRVAAGLTQAELAERSGISERTISDLERGVRATAYPSTARRLATALGVSQEDARAFLAQARERHSADVRTAAPAEPMAAGDRGRLPVPLTGLVGRHTERGLVLGLVGDPGLRLVTLIGPGGIGKTRLAIEVAAATWQSFSCSYFISLSDTVDPAMVLPAIASAAGVQGDPPELAAALARRWGDLSVLLVLDTFEHVVAAAPAVGELMTACPSLTVLATSRSALHLRGEREVLLPPLAVRSSEVAEAPPAAVQLFLERAEAVASGLEITAQALSVISEICTGVDGIPLAIELAAARVKHMPLIDLRMHLDERLDLLVGGARDLPARQQTMRAAVDWSYRLLGSAEKCLFRRLSVFRGGCDQQAVETVVGGTRTRPAGSVVSVLSSLVDASVVIAESGSSGRARYRMLDVIREYAVERASMADELKGMRRRHAEYFLALAERAEPELRGAAQREWYTRLLDEEGNFRAALGWAMDDCQAEMALRLSSALWMFWRWAGLSAEGRTWLDAAIEAGDSCSIQARCRGIWGAGWLAYHHGDYRRTHQLGTRLLALLDDKDDPVQRRNALTLTGIAALAQGRSEIAVTALGEACDLCDASDANWYYATSLLNLGTALLNNGRSTEAMALFEKALATYEQIGDRHFTARSLIQIGYTALMLGDSTMAEAPIRRAMETFAELGDLWGIAEGLDAFASLRAQGAPRSAAQLAGAARHLRERISLRAHPADASINEAFLTGARRRLSPEMFAKAWRQGQGLTPEAAVEAALDRRPRY